MLHSMDIAALHYFIEASQGRTLTSIAEQAHISRQAVSQSLQSLERECGAPLIERTRNGARITPAGERLLSRAKLIVEQHDLALRELQMAGDRPTLCVGYGKMTHNLWPWNHVDAFNQTRADFRVVRCVARQDELLARLNSGELDMIVSNMLLTDPAYRRILLRESPAWVIASKADYPEQPSEIAPELLDGKEVLLLPGNGNFNDRLKAYLSQKAAGCRFQTAVTDEIVGILQYLDQRTNCVYVSSGIFRESVVMPEGLFFAPLSDASGGAPQKDTSVYCLTGNRHIRWIRVYANYLKRILPTP